MQKKDKRDISEIKQDVDNFSHLQKINKYVNSQNDRVLFDRINEKENSILLDYDENPNQEIKLSRQRKIKKNNNTKSKKDKEKIYNNINENDNFILENYAMENKKSNKELKLSRPREILQNVDNINFMTNKSKKYIYDVIKKFDDSILEKYASESEKESDKESDDERNTKYQTMAYDNIINFENSIMDKYKVEKFYNEEKNESNPKKLSSEKKDEEEDYEAFYNKYFVNSRNTGLDGDENKDEDLLNMDEGIKTAIDSIENERNELLKKKGGKSGMRIERSSKDKTQQTNQGSNDYKKDSTNELGEFITKSHYTEAKKYDNGQNFLYGNNAKDDEEFREIEKVNQSIQRNKKLEEARKDKATYVTKGRYYGLYGDTGSFIGNDLVETNKLNTFYIADALPDKFSMSRFIFGNLNERFELNDYVTDFLINKPDNREVNGTTVNSMFKILKVLNTAPEAYKGNEKRMRYESTLYSVRPDYISFRSCYPLTIYDKELRCADNSTLINVKFYNLKQYEDYSKGNFSTDLQIKDSDKKLAKKIEEISEKKDGADHEYTGFLLKKEDLIKKSTVYKELEFYNFVKTKLLDTFVCPHFPYLLGSKIINDDYSVRAYSDDQSVNNYIVGIKETQKDQLKELKVDLKDGYMFDINRDGSNFVLTLTKNGEEKFKEKIDEKIYINIATVYNKQHEGQGIDDNEKNEYIALNYIKKSHPELLDKYVIKNPDMYTKKTLAVLTENSGYSFDSWFTPVYEFENNIKKMIETGYRELKEWKSIIFQILYTFLVMEKYNINIPDINIDNLFIRHSNISPMNDYYTVYEIDGLKYFVPYYGDTIVFDIIHEKDVSLNRSIIEKK